MDKLKTIVKVLDEKLAEDIVVIDMSIDSPICDYFVIASASNERLLLALKDHIEDACDKEGYYVFHAGTAKKDGQIVTNGGRVLGVVAKGDDLKQARANAYKAIDLVEFDNKYYRHDIGKAIDEA